jgi:1,4-dihydroxy-2-naphthoate octaprenyltransferase
VLSNLPGIYTNLNQQLNLMAKKLKGYFMLFRILPVLVWAFVGTLVGTSLAALETDEIIWLPFLLVLSISALVQGYPTHVLNEIFDWKSGADSKDLSVKKSGGSKVLQVQLLTLKDLWTAFVVSNLVLIGLVILCIKVIDINAFYYFFIPAYASALFYSLPPFRFAYRPFLGEWLGGFAGMFFLVVGSYYAQTLEVNFFVILNAFGLGLIYIGIMVFFHYLDFESDQLAKPKKNTTVVFLGLEGSRTYTYLCLAISAILFLIGTSKFYIQEMALLIFSGIVFFCHYKTDLRSTLSIIKCGKVITYSSLIIGLSFAAIAKPALLIMALPVLLSLWAYKKFGKLSGLKSKSIAPR